jgi:DNA-binding transcriptional LysR family regulator
MFELGHLRCFIAVADELHFGRAAARLHMTQPPLSRQIQQLEHHLQVELFNRSSRSVRLTPAGRSFLAEARRIVNLSESAALAARRVASGTDGSLALGFTASTGYSVLPRLLTSAKSRLRNIDFTLKEMVTQDQLDALSSGQLDIGFVRPPVDHEELESFVLSREKLVCAMPVGHRLSRRRSISVQDFDHEPTIGYSPVEARYFYDILASIFLAANVVPKYIHYMAQIHSIMALVQADLGIALVPEAARQLHFDNILIRDIDLPQRRSIDLHLVWRRANDNPALAGFLSLARGLAEDQTSMQNGYQSIQN